MGSPVFTLLRLSSLQRAVTCTEGQQKQLQQHSATGRRGRRFVTDNSYAHIRPLTVSLSPPSASPLQFVYSGEALRGAASELTGVLAEAITSPRLAYYEVDEQKHTLAELIEAAGTDPSQALLEGIHAAAYGSESPLGHNLYASAEDLEDVSSEVLKSFLGAQFTAANMVVVGASEYRERTSTTTSTSHTL
jgi:hypothetical protein